MGILAAIFGKPKKKHSHSHSPKPRKLSAEDIRRIEAKAKKDAAEYTKKWIRDNPELAKKFK